MTPLQEELVRVSYLQVPQAVTAPSALGRVQPSLPLQISPLTPLRWIHQFLRWGNTSAWVKLPEALSYTVTTPKALWLSSQASKSQPYVSSNHDHYYQMMVYSQSLLVKFLSQPPEGHHHSKFWEYFTFITIYEHKAPHTHTSVQHLLFILVSLGQGLILKWLFALNII